MYVYIHYYYMYMYTILQHPERERCDAEMEAVPLPPTIELSCAAQSKKLLMACLYVKKN